MRTRGSVVLVAWLMAASLPAFADQTVGTIRVTVSGPAGQTTTIEASSPADPSSRWSAEARGASATEIPGLPPAFYRVVAKFGNGTTSSLDLSLGNGEIVMIAVEPPSAMRIVDRRRLIMGTDFDARQLRDVPAGSGLSPLLDTAAPLVVADRLDTGGLALGTNARVSGQAASWTDTVMSFGTFPVPRAPGQANQLALYPDLRATEAVSVGSELASPDVTGPGVAITLVPRRPGAEWQGSVDGSVTTSSMVSANAPVGIPSIARLDSWRDFGVQAGGPLAPRRGIFMSGFAAKARSVVRDESSSVNTGVVSAVGHFVANPAERTQLRVLASVQAVQSAPPDLPQFRAAGIEDRDRFAQSQVAWERQTAGGSRVEIAGDFARGSFTPTGTLPSATVIDRAIDGIVPSPSSSVTTTRSDLQLQVQAPERRRHFMHVGATIARTTSTAQVLDTPALGELVYGLPARVWIPTAPAADSGRAAIHFAAYVNDHFAAMSRLTLDLGVRVGHSGGHPNGVDQSVSWNAILPRVSVRWAPDLVTLFGGYGRYQPDVSLDALAFGDAGEPVTDVYRWNDANGNARVDPGETGALVARAGRGPAVASIDPNVRPPRTDEFVIGAERRLGATMRIRIAQVWRRERDFVGSVNVGVPASSYVARQVPDRGEDYDSASDDRFLTVYDRLPPSFGQDRYLLTNLPGVRGSYGGTEISWQLNGRRWWSIVGASSYETWGLGGNRGFRANENDPGVIGELFEMPNAQSYARGAIMLDRQYVLKWSTAYHAAHDFLVSVVARYQDGQPLSRLIVVPDLAQGPELVNTYRAGRTRFTFTSTVDARIEKGLAIGRRRAAITLDVCNLPNMDLEIEEDPISGAGFRRTTAVQPPRAIRLGFHLAF